MAALPASRGMLAAATGIDTGGTPWGQAAAFIVGLPLGAALVAMFVAPAGDC